jgi:hypothetical protein
MAPSPTAVATRFALPELRRRELGKHLLAPLFVELSRQA